MLHSRTMAGAVLIASQRYFSQRNPAHEEVGSDADPHARQNQLRVGQDPAQSAVSTSQDTPATAAQHSSSSSTAYVGRSSLFPSSSSSSVKSAGRSSLRWQPEALIRSYDGPRDTTAAMQSNLGPGILTASAANLASESSQSSFVGSSASPLSRMQSGSWGRSSIGHTLGFPQERLVQASSAARGIDTGTEQQSGSKKAARSLLLAEASRSSSIGSPYSARLTMSPLSSKPSSPVKHSNGNSSSLALHNKGNMLRDAGSLDAGSWIYIMGNRSSSITAKQMARSSKSGAAIF